MTILAVTPHYLVETVFGDKGDKSDMLSIARYEDGFAVILTGPRIVAEFRKGLTTHSPEQTTRVFLATTGRPLNWQPCYKPARMPTATAQEA